jgi:hypothetical protein
MARQLSGQYTISTSDTSEKAVDGYTVDGNVIRVKNAGNHKMYIGNDGTDAVDDTTGYLLLAKESVEIRLDDQRHGGTRDLYVYGTAGDSLHYIPKG